MIPQETIEQIRQAADIVRVIGEYVRLKKRGRSFFALCPFHTEKTPSFHVSPEKQIYHCFGCGKGGNVFTFLMEHEKMAFIEAVRHLARKANIAIREDRRSDYQQEQLDRLNYANQVALEYFRQTLSATKYADVLHTYLRGKRNITDDAIDYFKLGLAGEEWEGLIHYAAKKDVTVDDLDKAGLVVYSEKTRKHLDRFRQRLMIPIFSLSQKPIAFGGRTLKKGEPAKYVNSPETPLYVKGNMLYGLNFAKDAIREANAVYIVEGYFDVISLWQVDIKNVVASSGTAFTPQQARLLARFAEEAYLFFDADSAGRMAALRSVEWLYDAGLEVKIIIPPEGEDPDSLARKSGKDRIEELRQDAVGFILYRIKDFDLASSGIIGKEKLVKELSAVGARIGDPTRRSLFYAEAAGMLSIDIQVFQRSHAARPADGKADPDRRKKHDAVEAGFLSLLFHNPGSIDTVFEKISPDDFRSKEMSRLYAAMITQYKERGIVEARTLIDRIQDSAFISLVTEIASTEWQAEQIEPETQRFVRLFADEKMKRVRDRLKKELAEAESEADHQRAERILAELRNYGLDVKSDQN